MLVRRCVLVAELVLAAAILVLLVVTPTYVCLHFVPENLEHTRCSISKMPLHLQKIVHETKSNTMLKETTSKLRLETSICRRLGWTHFLDWQTSYLTLMPCIFVSVLALGSACEMAEYNHFRGSVKSRLTAVVGAVLLVLIFFVLHHDVKKLRIRFSTMLLWIAVASALLISFVEAATVTSNNVLAEQFCAKFPALHMCRLREELVGSMVELQFLLQENDVSQGDVALPMADVQKRKSAFVRFGKRSPADGSDVEKRKSAFVRFGRSVPEEQTLDKQ